MQIKQFFLECESPTLIKWVLIKIFSHKKKTLSSFDLIVLILFI